MQPASCEYAIPQCAFTVDGQPQREMKMKGTKLTEKKFILTDINFFKC